MLLEFSSLPHTGTRSGSWASGVFRSERGRAAVMIGMNGRGRPTGSQHHGLQHLLSTQMELCLIRTRVFGILFVIMTVYAPAGERNIAFHRFMTPTLIVAPLVSRQQV